MTAEELLEAIGQVDDDLIEEAEAYRPPARKPLFSHWKPLAGGLAACLVLAAVFYLPFGAGGGANTTSGAGEADSSQASQAESSTTADSGSSGGSAPQEQEEQTSGSAANGSESSWDFVSSENLLYTPEGTYALTGEIVSALPEASRQLGVLFLEGENSTSQLYTTRREYAGCMLWQGPDGTLYVQIPGGGYAVGQAAE